MEKREIAMRLLDQDILEYQFEFKISSEYWYSVKYSKETGFETTYSGKDMDYILLDLDEDEFRNIIIK
jgi:hypothetical protein